jgi:hypothetical protein
MDSKQQSHYRLTAEDIEVRIWGFVVVMVTLVLVFIVAMLLYSVTFVTQPIKSMAPIDQAYTKMLNDIVLLIVGGIGGIMSKRAVKSAAEMIASNQPTVPPTQTYPPCVSPNAPQPTPSPYAAAQSPFGQPFGSLPVWVNPALDESWTPGPPPSTPPDYLDPSREEIAQERLAARSEA